ncbi:MAG: hypothetical protein CVU05_05035 [Bacteroidetes bacterium HGW-Bacteroidetes-21]|jgi:hypothetical protein|nr:MAG: hypothetical protein CVU05_05035 [Bacteroidetes bacterium HGW-Bacteroidetes-21]
MVSPSNYTIESVTIDVIMDLIKKVVVRYVGKKSIPIREKKDVEMAIMEKFLNQRDKINASFQKKSSVTTYYIAIFNRMCCEIIRNDNKHWYSITESDKEVVVETKASHSLETAKALIIKNEVKRLSNVLLFFNREQSKLLLFLKYYFNLQIDERDILSYSKDKYATVKSMLIPSDMLSQAELYNVLAEITNLVENKDLKGDAVRMWLNKNIDLILYRLNFNNESNHSRDSLKILMETGGIQSEDVNNKTISEC